MRDRNGVELVVGHHVVVSGWKNPAGGVPCDWTGCVIGFTGASVVDVLPDDPAIRHAASVYYRKQRAEEFLRPNRNIVAVVLKKGLFDEPLIGSIGGL